MTKSPPRKAHRILIVDDHAVVRRGIAALLAKEKDLQVCGEAGAYDEALAALARLRPDIALVDITLKDRSGLDLIRAARAAGHSTRMLVLSMHDESIYAEKSLRAGAHGYVMKEHADDVIVTAIRAVLGGGMYVSPELSSHLLKQYLAGELPPEDKTGVDTLTGRELEIFEGMGRGLTSRQIAEQYTLSERTVEVHRMHIKKKLACETAAEVLREAVRWVEQKKT